MLPVIDTSDFSYITTTIKSEKAHMAGHILIVADHIDLQRRLQTRLELAGYTTSLAQNGLEALESLENIAPAIILLDLDLPRMDGYTFLRALRQREADISSPLVFVLTADQKATSKLAIYDVAVFTKPYSFELLLTAMMMHC